MKTKAPRTGKPDPAKLTCPICVKPIGKGETVLLHMSCCGYTKAHRRCVKARPFYAKFLVECKPDVMFTRGV